MSFNKSLFTYVFPTKKPMAKISPTHTHTHTHNKRVGGGVIECAHCIVKDETKFIKVLFSIYDTSSYVGTGRG